MKPLTFSQTVIQSILLFLFLALPASAKHHIDNTNIKTLIDALETKRQQHHIPGMALAVVHNDQVIIAQGFGVMDTSNNKPVTADTLFAIGSTSKAFTATLAAMMVDADKLNWDDLVSDYLPSYEFNVGDEVLPITIKDMLSHRTGYSRNDLLWANGQASPKLILKTATAAEPRDEFRKNFHYNNVMYLAAGEVTADVAKQDWSELLAEKILKPLGMTSTTSVHETAVADTNIATGYQWNNASETNDFMPRRNLNNIAPAGGIYSNVNDMAQWLRLLLNQGQWQQQQLVSAEQLQATWQPAINIAGDINYGMGWFLRQWQGKKVIEHGGSIDGYGAQVALLPDENLGFVLLTNHTATPLQQESINMVWDHLATAAPATGTTSVDTALDYNEYVGEYHANFATFKDSIFTFLINESGVPAVDVPGQMVYELKDPDESGKWYFKLTDTIAVSFDRAVDNSITAMRMHQNRLDFELPKKGVEIKPEIAASELQPFLGEYQSKQFKGAIKAKIQNHRLTLDVPNQMAFELHLPDEDGFRQFRIKSDMSAKFDTDEANQVTHLVLYRDKQKVVDTAPKMTTKETEPLPTVAALMQLMQAKERSDMLSQKAGVQIKGEINMVNSGVKGKIMMEFDDEYSYRQQLDFGVFGEIIVTANENQAATDGINPYTEFKGAYRKQAQLEHPSISMNLSKHADDLKVTGKTEVNDRKAYVVSFKVNDLPSRNYYIDTENGDILRMKTRLINPAVGSVPITIDYFDYEQHHGLRLPMKTIMKDPMMGRAEINYKKVKAKRKFKPEHFILKP